LSDESTINPPSATAERAPDQPYVEMASVEPEPEKKRTYEGDDSTAAKAAARDLEKAREAASPPPRLALADDGTIKRTYQRIHDGSPVPPNETVSLERASADLKSVREQDLASQLPDPADIAARIDAVRGEYYNPQTQPPQADAQTPEQTQQQAQPAEQQTQDGIHPDVHAALQNIHVREALTRELATVEQARGTYAQASRQAAQVAAAAVLSQWPSLANLSAQELPHALSAIAKTDPATAAQIQGQLNRVQSLYDASVQAQKAQEKIQAERFQQFVAAEDAKFDEAVTAKESPQRMQEISQNAVEVLEEYGVSKHDIAELWRSNPLMRSSAAQRILADAARYRMAQKGIQNANRPPVPPVQSPGVSQPYSDGGVEAALARFNKDPNPKNAADLLTARRIARR
jgi:hypothetical protein